LGGHSIDDAEPKYGMAVTGVVHPDDLLTNAGGRAGDALVLTKPLGAGAKRSEEHTSELQSPCNLVCRLLLEKKKNTKIDQNISSRPQILGLPPMTSGLSMIRSFCIVVSAILPILLRSPKLSLCKRYIFVVST